MSLWGKIGLVLHCVLVLLIMGGLTLALLWGLMELMWNTKLSVDSAKLLMLGVREVVGIAGGFIVAFGSGTNQKRAVAGGILLGIMYFLVLLVVRLFGFSEGPVEAEDVLGLLILCVCPTVIGSLLRKKSAFHMKKAVL